ncbi:MAG: type 2 lanthipeptide synthetase LanM family protein, partial [Stenotrophomonas sp.]|uniref:type 2 lanthipeptide synthetase LanM family protein n=1 Tax=Stenotrophomonas sp. TaxID=69392 RepID=UPI003D6D16E4
MVATAANTLARIVRHFLAEPLSGLADALAVAAPALDAGEVDIIQTEAAQALLGNAQLKLNRLLLLELHAAIRSGQVSAPDPVAQLQQFEAVALTHAFRAHLDQRYPVLWPRFERMIHAQRSAILELAGRIGTDRQQLHALLDAPAGRLLAVSLGKGDLHAGGRTVARLAFEGGTVMYKPRSLRVDATLDAFLASVFPDAVDRVRVPRVIDHGTHGWAAFAAHRYCSNDEELQTYYRGLGHWLAVLRLIGGTDIHLENLIAVGPVPVVVDSESVFSKPIEATATGYGQAYDIAVRLMRNSVLRTGIVPFRTAGLGMEGVDLSAAGALPGEQPKVRVPVIVDDAEGAPRLGLIEADFAVAQNHPSPSPDVSRFWDHISTGFMQASRHLRALDASGELAVLLRRFEGCQVRDVRRPTMAYAELGRMLWHPASLHDEARAVATAMDLLVRNAAVAPAASADPVDVQGEIEAMRHGDIPIFVSVLDAARIDIVVSGWRGMRIDLEEVTIRSTLVATDLNEHALARAEAREGYSYAATAPHGRDLDARRRRQAAAAADNLIRLSIRGEDGTMTWITPEITRTGWTVQPVQPDLYFGLGGIAFSLAGYWCEVQAGRADAVDGLHEAMQGAVQVYMTMCRRDPPDPGGGLVGAGSRIWTLLALHALLRRPELLDLARDSAEAIGSTGFDAVPKSELLDGVAGAIVPLIGLSEATGEARWLDIAAAAARRLQATAMVDAHGVRWPTPQFEEPIGGFGHGAMGIGWALARLALTAAGTAAERHAWQDLAEGAFAFQDALYEPDTGRWRDIHLKDGQKNFPTWCHGSVGIGLAAADLLARTGKPEFRHMLRRAVGDANGKWGFSHTLCHGDLSTRELLVRAAAVDPEGCPYPVDVAAAEIISS